MSEQLHGAGDDVVVLPPLPADPIFVEAVEDAVAGEAAELPGAQPERRVGADPHDFASLYIRHRSSFALHARRFLTDPRDVEEVLQEAFLRLFLAMPELDTELQALSYCRRTVTNLCIDRYRADVRRPRLVELDALPVEPCDAAAYDDPVLRAEDAAIVREALALLSPLHREALIKREIEEKPLAQIAAELDVPEESVKHLLHRARRALRRLLVGTTVEPGVDLSNTEMLRIANERLARATLRSANVLIAVFVASLVVVGGFAVKPPDQREGSGELTPAVTPPVTGAAPDPAHAALHPAHAKKSHTHRSHSKAPSTHPDEPPLPPAPSVATTRRAPAVPVPRTPKQHKQQPEHQAPLSSGTGSSRGSDLRPGTFVIKAPTLGATGAAVVRTDTVELKPTGEWSNTSNFIAPAAAGDFTLQQVVERSNDGIVTAVVAPTLPATNAPAPALASTAVNAAPQQDGNVVVHMSLFVAPAPEDAVTVAAPLHIDVQAVYTPDVTQVLAEQVTVVEGSAPCCDSSANTTPPNLVSGGSQAPPLTPPAVGSAAVRSMSPTSRDDQDLPASS